METITEFNQAFYTQLITPDEDYTINLNGLNLLDSLFCKPESSGEVNLIFHTNNSDDIKIHFTDDYARQNLNVKIDDYFTITNNGNQNVSCTVLIGKYKDITTQKLTQDIGLSIINFLIILFLYVLPFIIITIVLKFNKSKNEKNENFKK